AERLRSQFLAFRPIDSIVTDIKDAIAAAGSLADFVSLVRVLFLGVEFASREESVSHVSLHEHLFDIGEVELAFLHGREGRELRIGGKTADKFTLKLLAEGFA